MSVFINNSRRFLQDFANRITRKADREPIATIADLNLFASTRSAFVAQKKLYGYLKTRIGTRYPKVFEDEAYVESIDIAKIHIFAACLSDLSIYCVARGLRDGRFSDAEMRRIAEDCYTSGLEDNKDRAAGSFTVEAAAEEFSLRLNQTDWNDEAVHGRKNFTASPKALVRWAPIAPELKRHDREIVENSIKFAWNEIRAGFEKRAVPSDIVSDARELIGPPG